MNDTYGSINKEELLEKIKQERYLLEETLSKLSQSDMNIPAFESGWTAKDILAHILSWEQLMVKWIGMALNGETPNDRPQSDEIINAMNAEIFANNQNRDLLGILQEFKTSHQQALEVIEGLSEGQLNDPALAPWRQGRPLWLLVMGNTWEHYMEHRQDIEAWLAKKG